MRRRLAASLLAGALSLAAAVDGTVTNRTTGKPQPGATVTLYKLGQAGMESLESVKSDAQGRFRIDRTPQGPHLIQTAYDGVTYNKMLPPGTSPTGLDIEVYNATRQSSAARVAQHMILFEPAAGEMTVSESLIYTNDGKTTFNDPQGGTLRFYLAESAGGKVRVTATAPQGMPIERAAEKTPVAGIYMVDFPIKPGETRFDLTYSLPFTSPGAFNGRLLHKGGPTRLVTPRGVTLKGEGIEPLGQEPTTQASIYNVRGAEYSVEITGTGSLRAAAAADEDSSPRIEQILPRIYDRLYVILALALAILAVGFVLHLRAAPKGPRA